MTDHNDPGATDLTLSRLLGAPRAAVWRAWTEPALLVQWWCPRPWTTELLAFDQRAGGAFHTRMRGPDGGLSDNPGSFLAVDPGRRLVFTSLLAADWRPATPWLAFTAVVALADEGAGTRYDVRVMHPDAATCQRHAELGFDAGWNACIDQLADLAARLG